MWVNIIVQDSDGNRVWDFMAEDKKSFTRMAKENSISIATSCNVWSCGMCKCKVIKWIELVQLDKISRPLWELKRDENGEITTIFTCVAWVKSEYLKDDKEYEIVLRRNI